MAAIIISKQFAWPVLSSVAIGVQVILQGFAVGGLRRKYKLDYPDMGTGRFSQKLTDEEWIKFNNYQRVHYNYVEGVTTAITLNVAAGIFYPEYAAIAGLTYIVGREVYAYGYRKGGSKDRVYGAVILETALVAMLGLAITGAVKALLA